MFFPRLGWWCVGPQCFGGRLHPPPPPPPPFQACIPFALSTAAAPCSAQSHGVPHSPARWAACTDAAQAVRRSPSHSGRSGTHWHASVCPCARLFACLLACLLACLFVCLLGCLASGEGFLRPSVRRLVGAGGKERACAERTRERELRWYLGGREYRLWGSHRPAQWATHMRGIV